MATKSYGGGTDIFGMPKISGPANDPFGIIKKAAPKPSAAAQQGKRLTAYANAQKAAGSAPQADEGMSPEDYLAWLLSQGGGGGGGGRGAAIAAMLADVDKREQAARDRYAKNSADVTTMYGQLASAISGYRPTIETDYDTQIASTNARAAEQQGALSDEMAAQEQRRMDAASSLGITGEQLLGGPELQSQAVLNEALGTIGNTATNWSGFLNAERGTALDRNQNTADAATATGAASVDELRLALEAYLQALDTERGQIRASGSSGGGGGGGGGGLNALQTYLGKALIDQMFAPGPEPSEFERNLQALNAFGVSPAMIGNAQYQKSLGAKGTFDSNSAQALGLFSLLGL